jgi:hypothetical protein
MARLTDEVVFALFASDLAQDVRSEFNNRREDGASIAEATGAVVGSFRHLLDRADEGPVVIVALAVLQLRDGALDATFRDAALDLLREGHGFELRPGENLAARRDRQRLRDQLTAALEAADVAPAADDEAA